MAVARPRVAFPFGPARPTVETIAAAIPAALRIGRQLEIDFDRAAKPDGHVKILAAAQHSSVEEGHDIRHADHDESHRSMRRFHV